MSDQNLHEQQDQDRKKYSTLIIQSTARNKVIIAVPGTGKSFTFKEFLKTKNGNNLAITFINNLAYDLQKDLGELAESHTFHGYCKKILHRISVDGIDTDFCYYPKLPLLIDSDSMFIGVNLEKVDKAFHMLIEDERIVFYLEQGNYYNAVSHNDAVYRVLKYFQADSSSLPTFCQIVVDEYQDFNLLEVTFIDELAKTSPVLIAGDDDQAVYDFKNASPKHVREKANNYERFELPYCSRCTQVIIDAVHDITKKAKTLNKLRDRVDKKYFCFLPDKEKDNIRFPKIIHANCSVNTKKAPYISKFIEKEINFISQEEVEQAKEKGCPCVLIAGPPYYTKQIYNYLKIRFTNIDFPEEQNKEIDILDGYKLLIKDKESNLGWRIILECVRYTNKAEVIKKVYESNQKLNEVIDRKFKNEQLSMVSVLERLKSGEEIANDDKTKIVNRCGHSFDELKKIIGVNEEIDQEEVSEEDTSISIKITTVNGSKGLSASYVFLVGMNNTRGSLKGFPADNRNPIDNEICQFIVGITRTRKKCYLISNRGFGAVYNIQKSIFIDWINPSRIDNITVNAEYFKSN